MNITSDNYVENAIKTESVDFDKIKDRLSNKDTIRLLHAAMGASTETGEFVDMLKKHIFYGKDIDFVNAKEEIGDVLWYAAIAADVLKETMNNIMTVNIKKLKKRYPDKFTENDAINRDTDEERTILENN